MEELRIDVRGIDATRVLIEPIYNDQLNVLNVFKVYSNVKHGKARIHHINEMDFNLTSDESCGFEGSTGSMNITDRTLNVYPVKGQLVQCYDEFKCTYLDELLNTGLEKPDIAEEVLNVILMQAEKALRKTWERLIWFGDRGSNNAAYNALDGLWTVHFAQGIADGEINNVDINSGTPLTAGKGIEILTKVWENAPNELKAAGNKAFYVTGSVYEQYLKDLEGQGLTCCVDQNYTNLVDGLNAVTFRGIPVIPFYSWDSYYAAQGQADQHRVLLTVPSENIVLGTDSASDLNMLESRFRWIDEKVYTRMRAVLGVDYATELYLSLGL